MDLTQLSQMVGWLDEEHRRDREELAKLGQRLQSMTVENQEQARRIQELEGRLASTQAQLTQFAQLQQALQQLKNEVIVMLDKQSDARLQGERETERARLSDREALSRGLAEIRKEIPRLGRVEEELVSRQAEDQRLSEMLLAMRQSLNNVSKDLDERTRTLPYMVEQRALDNKRIAQLQGEHVEIMKRTDALASKPPVFEERIGRLEKELQRIQPIPDQLRNDQQAFLESRARCRRRSLAPGCRLGDGIHPAAGDHRKTGRALARIHRAVRRRGPRHQDPGRVPGLNDSRSAPGQRVAAAG